MPSENANVGMVVGASSEGWPSGGSGTLKSGNGGDQRIFSAISGGKATDGALIEVVSIGFDMVLSDFG